MIWAAKPSSTTSAWTNPVPIGNLGRRFVPTHTTTTPEHRHQGRVGHQEAAEVNLLALVGEGAIRDVTQVLDGTVDVVRVADDENLVADMEVVVRVASRISPSRSR